VVSEGIVTVNRQRLSKKVSKVVTASNKTYCELALADTALYPVQPHVDTFRHFRPDRGVGKSNGTFVITQNRGGGLRVPETGENSAFV